jgi:hypothetical protein
MSADAPTCLSYLKSLALKSQPVRATPGQYVVPSHTI